MAEIKISFSPASSAPTRAASPQKEARAPLDVFRFVCISHALALRSAPAATYRRRERVQKKTSVCNSINTPSAETRQRCEWECAPKQQSIHKCVKILIARRRRRAAGKRYIGALTTILSSSRAVKIGKWSVDPVAPSLSACLPPVCVFTLHTQMRRRMHQVCSIRWRKRARVRWSSGCVHFALLSHQKREGETGRAENVFAQAGSRGMEMSSPLEETLYFAA